MKPPSLFSRLAVAILIIFPCGSQSATGIPRIDLGYATYQGTRLAAGVDQYLGIRYAAPPTGDLRWRAPQDPPPVDAVQNATSFGPVCIGVDQGSSSSRSEDCLFVNVFTPSNATESSKLSVWAYIPGGGYMTSGNNNYNATNVIQMSNFNLVFVSFTYRVGALGFLASEKVRENGDLNVGLLDQRKALEWIQENIKFFGGDPGHVVLHGTSAGAGSVSHHLTAYGGRDDHLFVGAIMQAPFWPTQRTIRDMEFQYDRFVNDTGCSAQNDTLSCLRALPLKSIIPANINSPYPGAATNTTPERYWLPAVDDDMIQGSLYQQFENGLFVGVPVIVGNSNDEGSNYAPDAASPEEIHLFFKDNYPDLEQTQLEQITDIYTVMDPVPKHKAWFPSASAAYGDALFTNAGYEIARWVAKHFSYSKAWNYRYNVRDPSQVAAGLGVPHASESTAIFGVGYAGSSLGSYSTINAPIIPVVMNYWLSFIQTLNPNTLKYESAPYWKSWGREPARQRLKLETNATMMEEVPRNATIHGNLWKELAANMCL